MGSMEVLDKVSSQSVDINSTVNYEVEIANLYCCFRYCQAGPFTEAELFEHLSKHYRKAPARKLTHFIKARVMEGKK